MSGQPEGGNTHCGRWVRGDIAKHGVRRLTCTKPRYHSDGWHKHGYTGWMWWAGPSLFVGNRAPEIVRDWTCHGWVPELGAQCGRTYRATEDGARAKGWKVQGGAFLDQLCPQCGRADPETLRLVRDLERSLAPT